MGSCHSKPSVDDRGNPTSTAPGNNVGPGGTSCNTALMAVPRQTRAASSNPLLITAAVDEDAPPIEFPRRPSSCNAASTADCRDIDRQPSSTAVRATPPPFATKREAPSLSPAPRLREADAVDADFNDLVSLPGTPTHAAGGVEEASGSLAFKLPPTVDASRRNRHSGRRSTSSSAGFAILRAAGPFLDRAERTLSGSSTKGIEEAAVSTSSRNSSIQLPQPAAARPDASRSPSASGRQGTSSVAVAGSQMGSYVATTRPPMPGLPPRSPASSIVTAVVDTSVSADHRLTSPLGLSSGGSGNNWVPLGPSHGDYCTSQSLSMQPR